VESFLGGSTSAPKTVQQTTKDNTLDDLETLSVKTISSLFYFNKLSALDAINTYIHSAI